MSVRRLAAAVFAFLALTTATPAIATAKPLAVRVTVPGGSVAVSDLPCKPTKVAVGMTNTSSEDIVVDLLVQPDRPLETSRAIISSWLPAKDPDQTVTPSMDVTAARGTRAGRHQVAFRLNKRVAAVLDAQVVPAAPRTDGENLLEGERASASSTHQSFNPCGAVDGATTWPKAWNDGTLATWPDTFEVSIPQARQIGRVEVTTINTASNPAATHGLTDWDVQVRAGGAWVTVDQVRGNDAAARTSTFAPVSADGVRILALGSAQMDYSRIAEVRAFAS